VAEKVADLAGSMGYLAASGMVPIHLDPNHRRGILEGCPNWEGAEAEMAQRDRMACAKPTAAPLQQRARAFDSGPRPGWQYR
jgi:hypothetical protein